MANLKQWILEAVGDEEILGVVIGAMGWGDYGKEAIPNYDDIPKNVVLSWDEAAKWLDYKFSAGYGAPGCNAIYVWTATKTGFIVQYDGATALHWVPNKPQDCKPEMPGG